MQKTFIKPGNKLRRPPPTRFIYKTKDDYLRWLREQELLKKQVAEEQNTVSSRALMVWVDDGGSAD